MCILACWHVGGQGMPAIRSAKEFRDWFRWKWLNDREERRNTYPSWREAARRSPAAERFGMQQIESDMSDECMRLIDSNFKMQFSFHWIIESPLYREANLPHTKAWPRKERVRVGKDLPRSWPCSVCRIHHMVLPCEVCAVRIPRKNWSSNQNTQPSSPPVYCLNHQRWPAFGIH